MNLANELWYNVFSFLTNKSMSKFSCLWNLYNLGTKEIELMYASDNLWVDTAEKGYIKLIRVLIKVGVDLNIQNNTGVTALHLASIRGYKEIVKLLEKN